MANPHQVSRRGSQAATREAPLTCEASLLSSTGPSLRISTKPLHPECGMVNTEVCRVKANSLLRASLTCHCPQALPALRGRVQPHLVSHGPRFCKLLFTQCVTDDFPTGTEPLLPTMCVSRDTFGRFITFQHLGFPWFTAAVHLFVTAACSCRTPRSEPLSLNPCLKFDR